MKCSTLRFLSPITYFTSLAALSPCGWAGLGKNADGPRRFGLIFGAIYTLVAIAGFGGLRDLGPIQLDLNTHFNFIHLGVGLLSLAAGLASSRPVVSH